MSERTLPRWGRGGALLFAAVASVALTGCSPANQGAVTLDAGTSRPALVLALCDDEFVTAVRLNEATTDSYGNSQEGAELWRIEAVGPQRLTRFVVGVVPPGFVERKTLPPQLPPKLLLEAEMAGGLGAFHGSFFEPSDLQAGVLFQEGRRVSEAELRRAARGNCTSNPAVLVGLPTWVGWLLIPVFALGVFLLAKGLRGYRKTARTPFTGWPPPAQ